MTNNNKGMEMSTLSPLFEEWVQSYDGEHPLVDLGCAFGRNVSAAATRLAETQRAQLPSEPGGSPALGSVSPKQPTSSPVARRGRSLGR